MEPFSKLCRSAYGPLKGNIMLFWALNTNVENHANTVCFVLKLPGGGIYTAVLQRIRFCIRETLHTFKTKTIQTFDLANNKYKNDITKHPFNMTI